MNYHRFKNYSTEEFLEDPIFRDWVRRPDPIGDKFWADFLAQYPEQTEPLKSAQSTLSEMQNYFESTSHSMLPEQGKFRARLIETMEMEKAKHISSRHVNRNRLVAIAAGLFLLLGIAGLIWQQNSAQYVTYATGFEEWKTLTLPDASVVKLNANSEIRLAEEWTEGEDRRVWLKGEAFFEVEKKPQTGVTFTVITDDLSIEVLGTSFNVHSRGEQTNVFLEEGKIKLALDGHEKILAPGDLLTYSSRKNVVTEQYKASASKHISWKDGTLILRNTPSTEILKKIQEIYGVAIVIESEKVKGQIKTVGVPMDKLEIAIPILERTLDAKITHVGSKLIIK